MGFPLSFYLFIYYNNLLYFFYYYMFLVSNSTNRIDAAYFTSSISWMPQIISIDDNIAVIT